MSNATTSNGTTKAAAAMTSFGIVCPRCNDEDAAVKMDLNDLGQCECSCGEEFTVTEAMAELAARMEKWAAVLRWIDLAPRA